MLHEPDLHVCGVSYILFNIFTGDLYGEWLDRFAKAQKGDLQVEDIMTTLGWGRYLLKM